MTKKDGLSSICVRGENAEPYICLSVSRHSNLEGTVRN